LGEGWEKVGGGLEPVGSLVMPGRSSNHNCSGAILSIVLTQWPGKYLFFVQWSLSNWKTLTTGTWNKQEVYLKTY